MELKEWEEKVSQCIKCGNCLSVCPVYLETHRETLVARGKLSILSGYFSDLLPANKEIFNLLSNCLLCGACAEYCPGGVKADDLIQQGRSLLLEKVGAAKGRRLLAKKILPFPDRLKTFRKGQNLLFKKVPEERGLKLRFSSDPKTWPALAQPFFLDRKAIPTHPGSFPSFKIGYFVGCTTNYLYPEIGEAALKLIRPFGKVNLPAGQTCCGLPAFSLGDINTARDLARKNILAFSGHHLDAIVVACSSCAAHIKIEYPRLLTDDSFLMPKVEEFVQKVEELSQFLIKQEISPSPPPAPLNVAFHDPCHAKRKLKIFGEPRKLLSSVPGLTLVELEGHRCCGHGGSIQPQPSGPFPKNPGSSLNRIGPIRGRRDHHFLHGLFNAIQSRGSKGEEKS